MRQGALDGVMLAAIAQAAEVPEAAVRRATMLAGLCRARGRRRPDRRWREALDDIHLEVGRPLRPMLAASAPDVAAAWEQVGDTADGVVVDGKLDGIRLQAHRDGDDVRLFTRSLDDITDRLPEVVEAVLALPVDARSSSTARPSPSTTTGRPLPVPADRFSHDEQHRRRRAAGPPCR